MICYDCIRKTWRIKRRSACVYQWVTKPCPVCLSCCRRSCLRRRRSSMQLGQKMWVIFSSRIFQWKIWSILRLTLTHVASYVLKLNRQTDPSTCHRYSTSGSMPWIPRSERISQGSDRCRCQRFIRKALTSVLDGSLAFFFLCPFLMCCSEMNTENIGMPVFFWYRLDIQTWQQWNDMKMRPDPTGEPNNNRPLKTRVNEDTGGLLGPFNAFLRLDAQKFQMCPGCSWIFTADSWCLAIFDFGSSTEFSLWIVKSYLYVVLVEPSHSSGSHMQLHPKHK